MTRILLVEDNVPFRQAFKDALLSQFPTLQVEEASEGVRALEILQEYHPQLVFMDINLPGENGLTITTKIKQLDPVTKVVILTAHDTDEYRQAAKSAGTSGFVVKSSLNMPAILALTRKVMGLPAITAIVGEGKSIPSN